MPTDNQVRRWEPPSTRLPSKETALPVLSDA
jgi:hypothetical protein